MKSILLNNGITMPLVGLGTWDLRGKECIETVAKAINLGYRLIDTAQMYDNEIEVGKRIIKSGINRSELFITTKIYRPSNSYDKAKKAIDISLKRLGLDYVDLLLLHEPYKQGIEMYKALEEALIQEKTRAIGISNYDEHWYSDFRDKCKIIPAVNQVEAHVYFQKWNFQQILNDDKVVLQAWSPLAQGIGNLAENPILKSIGNKYNKTAMQVALRFLVQRNIAVIPKSKHEDRLKANIEIFDFYLSDEDILAIKKLDRNDTLFAWTKQF